jgi:hypothetical protein
VLFVCYSLGMNISPETRAAIIKEHRSAAAKKAARTMRKKFGKDYFKKQGSKGGSIFLATRKPTHCPAIPDRPSSVQRVRFLLPRAIAPNVYKTLARHPRTPIRRQGPTFEWRLAAILQPLHFEG